MIKHSEGLNVVRQLIALRNSLFGFFRRSLFITCVSTAMFVQGGSPALAEVGREKSSEPALNALFTDHMILQRNMPVPVYGTAKPKQIVTVEFAGQKKTAEADENGNWMVKLDPMSASSEPSVLTVTSQTPGFKLQISDVLVGDIWLCAGQSNMASVMQTYPSLKSDIPLMQGPAVRLFKSKHEGVGSPVQTDTVTIDGAFSGSWQSMTPRFAAPFSATACFFGRKLQQDTGVPIGLIYANRGGTQVNMWLPMSAMAGRDVYAKFLSKKNPEWTPRADNPGAIRAPSYLYNGTIHPLTRFAIRGVIWYQGESDDRDIAAYPVMFKDLIETWRKAWGYDFPFLFVQLPSYGAVSWDNTEEAWAWQREAQASALKLPETGMVVLIDSGEYKDIHPQNKKSVGERLALLAESLDDQKIAARSPMIKSVQFKEGKACITFSEVGSGLTAKRVVMNKNMCLKQGEDAEAFIADADTLEGFMICGADRKFVKAQAEIIGPDTVRIWSDAVRSPVAVRYGWANFSLCNLYNGAGLTAVPFRTDHFEMPVFDQVPALDDTIFEISKPTSAFSADFSRDRLDGWQKSLPLNTAVNGEMLELFFSEGKPVVFYPPSATVKEQNRFSVETDFAACRMQAWGGIAFNYVGPDDFYVVRICAGTTESQFIHYRNGKPLVLDRAESSGRFEVGKSYRIKVQGVRTGSFKVDGLYKFEICEASTGQILVSRVKRDGGSATFGGSVGCYLGIPSAEPLFKYSRFVFSAGN
ncbi:MAG: hypothetical protein HOO88_05850 [Kiritimatiellaceae bacterium]|nr:hypothetical protein [Kiritimatiellaceae bacterium]